MSVSRRNFISMAGMATLVPYAFSSPVKSSIGGFLLSHQEAEEGGGIPRGYTEHSALEAIDYRNNLVPIDSGVLCPQSGNWFVECDFVMKGSGIYTSPVGLRPIVGNSCSLFFYGSSTVYFKYGNSDSQTFNRRGTFSVGQGVSCGYGMEDGHDIIRVNDESWAHEEIGGERGAGASTFRFVGSANLWDDLRGTKVGCSRIYIEDSVVWDGIPCTRDTDGVPGFYDLVERRFCIGTKGIAAWDMEEVSL